MTWKDRLKMFALGVTTAAATTSCVGAGEEMSITKSDTQQEPTELSDEEIMEKYFSEDYGEHKDKLAKFNDAVRPDDNRVPSEEIIQLRKQLKQAKVPMVKGDSVLVSFTRINKGTEEKPKYEFTDLQYINKNQPQAILTQEVCKDDPSIIKYSMSIYDSKDYSLDENTADIKQIASSHELKIQAIEKHKREYYDSASKTLVKEISVLPGDTLKQKMHDMFFLNYVKGSKKK